MGEDEKICYLTTTLPLDAWRQITEAIRKILDARYGRVMLTINASKLDYIDITVSEKIDKP